MLKPVAAIDPSLLLLRARNCQPAASIASTRPHEAPSRTASPELASILIVDDDACVRETLAEILELEGYTVFQAQDAGATVEILQDMGPSVLITDLSMPGDDGIALIRRARHMGQTAPVILLTGYAEETATISTVAGANIHVLRKPVEARQLLQQITSLLQVNTDGEAANPKTR